jgi:hypothetical protein
MLSKKETLTFDKLRVNHLDIHLFLIRSPIILRLLKVMFFWLIEKVIDISEDGLVFSNKCGLIDRLHLKQCSFSISLEV